MGRIALASVLGAALCLLSGCGGCQGDKGKAGEGLSTLPAGATMVVAIDLPALMGDKGLSAFETLMKQQLGDTLKPVTAAGLELSALEQIILWKDEGADNPAVIVLGKFDAKKAVEGLAALGGGPQVLGDNGLLLAPPKVAAKIIAAREGKAPQLDMTKAPGAYLKKVGTNGGLVFAIAEKHEHFAGRLSLAGDIEIAVYGSQIPAEMVSQAKEQLGMVKLSAGMLSPELVMQQFPAEIVGGLQGMDLERIIAIGKELIEQTELDVIDATSILATTSASATSSTTNNAF